MQVPPLASLYGLRIWCCRELLCRSLMWLQFDPQTGNFHMHRHGPKKKQKKRFLQVRSDWRGGLLGIPGSLPPQRKINPPTGLILDTDGPLRSPVHTRRTQTQPQQTGTLTVGLVKLSQPPIPLQGGHDGRVKKRCSSL